MKFRLFRFIAVVLGVFALTSCGRSTQPKPEQTMRQVQRTELHDGLGKESLVAALERQVDFLSSKSGDAVMRFGPREISRAQYVEGLERFKDYLTHNDLESSLHWLQEHFDFFEVYGDRDWGEVFVTGYFEPRIKGARHRTEQFTQALYRKPDNIYRLKLSAFDVKAEAPRELRAMVEGDAIVPYFSRTQIDAEAKLAGKGLEICWVNPVDAFFLQIQGSGVVELDDGEELKLIYAEKNGAPYHAIGKFLKAKIAPEEVTMFSLERYLHTLPPADLQTELNRNPSYVFFKEHIEGAITFLGVRASAGRTIATDKRHFPKGGLAFLDLGDLPRLVLDQDIGGAITGLGRVDLFTGSGEEGKSLAGGLKQRGRLVYLVPKG